MKTNTLFILLTIVSNSLLSQSISTETEKFQKQVLRQIDKHIDDYAENLTDSSFIITWIKFRLDSSGKDIESYLIYSSNPRIIKLITISKFKSIKANWNELFPKINTKSLVFIQPVLTYIDKKYQSKKISFEELKNVTAATGDEPAVILNPIEQKVIIVPGRY